MNLLELTLGTYGNTGAGEIASATGGAVQDINSVKSTRDPSRLEFDPDLENTKSPVRHERSNIYKKVLDSLSDLELFLVRSDDLKDAEVRDGAAQLRTIIVNRIKNATPMSAMTGPNPGGVTTAIGGVAQ